MHSAAKAIWRVVAQGIGTVPLTSVAKLEASPGRQLSSSRQWSPWAPLSFKKQPHNRRSRIGSTFSSGLEPVCGSIYPVPQHLLTPPAQAAFGHSGAGVRSDSSRKSFAGPAPRKQRQTGDTVEGVAPSAKNQSPANSASPVRASNRCKPAWSERHGLAGQPAWVYSAGSRFDSPCSCPFPRRARALKRPISEASEGASSVRNPR